MEYNEKNHSDMAFFAIMHLVGIIKEYSASVKFKTNRILINILSYNDQNYYNDLGTYCNDMDKNVLVVVHEKNGFSIYYDYNGKDNKYNYFKNQFYENKKKSNDYIFENCGNNGRYTVANYEYINSNKIIKKVWITTDQNNTQLNELIVPNRITKFWQFIIASISTIVIMCIIYLSCYYCKSINKKNDIRYFDEDDINTDLFFMDDTL